MLMDVLNRNLGMGFESALPLLSQDRQLSQLAHYSLLLISIL